MRELTGKGIFINQNKLATTTQTYLPCVLFLSWVVFISFAQFIVQAWLSKLLTFNGNFLSNFLGQFIIQMSDIVKILKINGKILEPYVVFSGNIFCQKYSSWTEKHMKKHVSFMNMSTTKRNKDKRPTKTKQKDKKDKKEEQLQQKSNLGPEKV